MFNGFQSTVTPSVQIWDFSNPNSGQLSNPGYQVSLSDDCATNQIFYVGGTYYPIRVTLPTASAPGKIINIRVELLGTVNSPPNGLYVLDSQAPVDQIIGKLGTPGYMSFVSVQYPKKGSPAYYNLKWIVLSGSASASALTGIYAGQTSAQFGDGNIVSGTASFAAGGNNTNSGFYSIALGQGHVVSSLYSSALGGNANTADGNSSAAVGGYYGTTNGIQNKTVFPGDSLGTLGGKGVLQNGTLNLATQTTDATATVLRSNTSAAGTANQLTLQNNSAMYVLGSVIANITGAGNTSAWTFQAVIKRGANAASTTMVQSSVTLVGQNAGASGWVVAVSADTTNGALAVTVTGQAATTIRWVANLLSTEVGF